MSSLFTLNQIPVFGGLDSVELDFCTRFGLQVHFPNLKTETGNHLILVSDYKKSDGSLELRLDAETMFDIYHVSKQYEWTYQAFLEQVRSWFPKSVGDMIELVRKSADDWIKEVQAET